MRHRTDACNIRNLPDYCSLLLEDLAMARTVNPQRHVEAMKSAKRLLDRGLYVNTLQELLASDEDPKFRMMSGLLTEEVIDVPEYFAYGKPVSASWLMKLGKLYKSTVNDIFAAIEVLKDLGFEISKLGRYRLLGDVMTTEGLLETASGFGEVTSVESAISILKEQGFTVDYDL